MVVGPIIGCGGGITQSFIIFIIEVVVVVIIRWWQLPASLFVSLTFRVLEHFIDASVQSVGHGRIRATNTIITTTIPTTTRATVELHCILCGDT